MFGIVLTTAKSIKSDEESTAKMIDSCDRLKSKVIIKIRDASPVSVAGCLMMANTMAKATDAPLNINDTVGVQ